MARIIENALHMELHELSVGDQPYLSEPEERPQPEEPEDGIPF